MHNGTLTSPAYGSASYPNNQVCTYRIRHPEGNAISLMFLDMNLHPSDFVEVGNNTFTIFSMSRPPFDLSLPRKGGPPNVAPSGTFAQ